MHWITELNERGSACITIQNNFCRNQDICKISRNTAAQGKQIKLDSSELVVSSCTYLAVVRDVKVISYRWVFCCQCVNLYGGRRAQTVSLPVQDFSHAVHFPSPSPPPPTFLFLFLSYYFFPPYLSSKELDLNRDMLAMQQISGLQFRTARSALYHLFLSCRFNSTSTW